MHDQDFMMLAIKEAEQSQEPVRCGVVIAQNGLIVASAHNQQRVSHNATAHAEILALQEAGQKLKRKNLHDCVIYCTCEPCTMCLSAIIFAKIPKLFFGSSLSELEHLPIRLTTSALLETSDHHISVTGSFLKEECDRLLQSSLKSS